MRKTWTICCQALLALAILFAFCGLSACGESDTVPEDLSLSSVKAGTAALTFDGTDTYTLAKPLPNGTKTINFSFETSSADAYVEMEGGFSNKALKVGKNLFDFTVRGATQSKSYHIELNRAALDDLTLAGLSVNGKSVVLTALGTPDDPFEIFVGDESVTEVGAELNNPDASFEVKSEGSKIVYPVALTLETAKTLQIFVTNGTKEATYDLCVIRADTSLAEVLVDGEAAELDSDGVYTFGVDRFSVTLTFRTGNEQAVATVLSGDPKNLVNGDNEFVVNVVRSGVNAGYTLRIRCDVPDTGLEKITVAGLSFDPENAIPDENGVKVLRVFVASGLTKFPVEVKKSNSEAVFSADPSGSVTLENGKKDLVFSVSKPSAVTGETVKSDYRLVIRASFDSGKNVLANKPVLYLSPDGKVIECATGWGHKMSSVTDETEEGVPNLANTSTAAVTSMEPSSIYIDLLQVFEIDEVRICFALLARDYTINVSADGSDWAVAATVTDYAGATFGYAEHVFDPVEARFVRIDVTDTDTDPGYGTTGAGYNIADLQVIGRIPGNTVSASLVPVVEVDGETMENRSSSSKLIRLYDFAHTSCSLEITAPAGSTLIVRDPSGKVIAASVTDLPLAVGNNNFVITVEKDGFLRTYELDVRRVGKTIADVESIFVNGILAEFDEERQAYAVAIDVARAELTVNVPEGSGATWQILSGNVENLRNGENVVKLRVTAQDGDTVKDYQLIVTADVAGIMLTNLTLGGTPADVSQDTIVFEYPQGASSLAYSIVTGDPEATVSIKRDGTETAVSEKIGTFTGLRADTGYEIAVSLGRASRTYRLRLRDASYGVKNLVTMQDGIELSSRFHDSGTLEAPAGGYAQTNFAWNGLECILDGGKGAPTMTQLPNGEVTAGMFSSVTLDFKKLMRFDSMEIYFANIYSREFVVQYSADGETYATLQHFENVGKEVYDAGYWLPGLTVDVQDEFVARYVRIVSRIGEGYCIADDFAWRGISLAEIILTGREGGAEQA